MPPKETEPRSRATCTEHLVKLDHAVSQISELSEQRDKHTQT